MATDRRAVHALVTGAVIQAMVDQENPWPVNGTPQDITFDGRTWQVALQDVQGLVDIYLAPPAILKAIGIDPNVVLDARATLQDTTPFGRLATLEQTLAVMGIAQEKAPMLTQNAENPGIRLQTSPTPLKTDLRSFDPSFLATGQTTTVNISLIAPAR